MLIEIALVRKYHNYLGTWLVRPGGDVFPAVNQSLGRLRLRRPVPTEVLFKTKDCLSSTMSAAATMGVDFTSRDASCDFEELRLRVAPRAMLFETGSGRCYARQTKGFEHMPTPTRCSSAQTTAGKNG